MEKDSCENINCNTCEDLNMPSFSSKVDLESATRTPIQRASGEIPLREINANSTASSFTSRRLLRSGSTFGEMDVIDTKMKQLKHTPTRRRQGIKKEDNSKLLVSSIGFPNSNLNESEENSIGTCNVESKCESYDKMNSVIVKTQLERSCFSKERQRDDHTTNTLTPEKTFISTPEKITPSKFKSKPTGDNCDKSQSQVRLKVKSDHLKSLLHAAEVQVTTSATASTPSQSSSFSAATATSRLLPASFVPDRNKDAIKSHVVSSLKPKASLLTHQTNTPNRNIDFTQVQPVPDETFYVSLSKDETKELSMLATTKGTVRVNSTISKKQYEPSSSTTIFNDDTLTCKQEDCKKNEGERCILKTVLSPNSKVNNESRGVDCKIPVLLKEDKKKKVVLDHEASDCVVNQTGSDEVWDNIKSQLASQEKKKCDADINDIKTDEKNSDHSLLPQKNTCEKDLRNDLLEKPHRVVTTNPTPRPVSHFPLMEEILTHQSRHPFDKKDSMEIKSDIGMTSSQAYELPSTTTLSTLISVDSICSRSKSVKRSERIRCKSGLDNETVSPSLSRQSVISTMTPVDKHLRGEILTPSKKIMGKTVRSGENKQKLSITAPKAPLASSSVHLPFSSKSKSSTKAPLSTEKSSSGKKKKEKNMKSSTMDFPLKKMPKKGKDFSKAKACMSREVMDGIVKSIEETVSRIRESAELEDLDSDQSITKREENANPSENFASKNSLLASDVNSSNVNSKNSNVKQTVKELSKQKTSCITKLYKNKSVKSAKKRVMQSRSKKDSSLLVKTSKNSSPLDNSDRSQTSSMDSVTTTKRFRKKTRKAEEALGEHNILWDVDWPIKKSKAKKRSCHNTTSPVQESSNKVGQRRSRRGQPDDTSSPDPVLEEHAFILWASENRSELELKFPNVSTCELDAVLSAKWCDVTSILKTKYFSRAKEAFSDDDRRRIWSNHSSYGDLDSDVLCGFIMDRDPVFSDFIRMPVHRQRDLLRKWLKFFQEMMPRKEYVEFIANFKRACGRDDFLTKSGKPKRTHMRSIDPSHYKMLFDLIRLSKPRVLEVYKERRGKEKNMISTTYSLMLKHLVNDQTWPHLEVECHSYLLTELFHDLDELDQKDEEEKKERLAGNDIADDDFQPVATMHNTTNILADNDHSSYYRQPHNSVAMETDSNWSEMYSFGEEDLAVLDTEFAKQCLSDLAQLTEIPELDQQVLDQVFFQLPANTELSTNPSYVHKNIYSNHSEHNSILKLTYSNNHAATHPTLIYNSTGNVPSFSNMNTNINYHSAVMPSPGCFMQPAASSPYQTTMVPHKFNQYLQRENQMVRSRSLNSKSEIYPKLLPGYGTTVDNMRHMSHSMDMGNSTRCIRVRSSKHFSNTQQLRMPYRPYQLPIGVPPRSSRNAQQIMSLTSANGYNNNFPTDMSIHPRVINNTSHFPLDKSASTGYLFHHHSSGSRNHGHHHHGNSSPLITSLCSMRTIRSRASNITYQAQQSGQMVPCSRSKLFSSSGSHQNSHTGYRRSLHSLPITSGPKVTSIQNNSFHHQVKVCLPSQALKIPIAKLKGSRKTSFVRNNLKTAGIPFDNSDLTFDSSHSHLSHDLTAKPTAYSENQSFLAKVLKVQENDAIDTPESANSGVGYKSLSSSSSSTPMKSFISPQDKENFCIISTESRMDSKVQLISIIGNNLNNKSRYSYSTTSGSNNTSCNSNTDCLTLPSPRFRTCSPQKAIVVNPLYLHKNSTMPRVGSCRNSFGNLNVRTATKTPSIPLNFTSENALSYFKTSSKPTFCENITSILETAPSQVHLDKKQTIEDQCGIRSTCNTPLAENQTNISVCKFASSNSKAVEICSETAQSTLKISQPTLNSTPMPLTLTSCGVSAAQSVSLLMPSSDNVTHLHTDNSVSRVVMKHCACRDCKNNNSTGNADAKTSNVHATTDLEKEKTHENVMAASLIQQEREPGEEITDSDDNKEIKSISLHDTWDIALSNSISTQATPEVLHTQTSQLSTISTISCLSSLPKISTMKMDGVPVRSMSNDLLEDG